MDFADDIWPTLLESSWAGINELIKRVEKDAATVGLRINGDETKIMVVEKRQRMILEIKWKDKITNEEVRRRSGIT